MDGWMEEWVDGRMGRWTDGWKDGWMDRMGEVAGGWLLGGSSGWGLTHISACCRYLLHISALLPAPRNLLVQVLGLGMLSSDWAEPGSPWQAPLWDVWPPHFTHAIPQVEGPTPSAPHLHPSSLCCTLKPTSSSTLLHHFPFQAFSK